MLLLDSYLVVVLELDVVLELELEPEPESVLADLAGSGADDAAGGLSDPEDLASVAGAEVPPEPPLKSVTYQPEPLS